MTFMTVNLLAVVLGGVANMILGMLWYSPLLFGNVWIKAMGLTAKKLESMKTNMGFTYGMSFVSALIQAAVLGYLFSMTASTSIVDGVVLGALAGVGFIATSMITGVLYEQKSWTLYFINIGYQVVSLMIMGGLIGLIH